MDDAAARRDIYSAWLADSSDWLRDTLRGGMALRIEGAGRCGGVIFALPPHAHVSGLSRSRRCHLRRALEE